MQLINGAATRRPKGIIVLEGSDCTGKTTLARRLVEKFGAVYIHNRFHKNVWPFFMASLRWAVRESQNRLVVIDRHWPSECVYADVYRGGSTIGADCRALHRVFLRYGALYVLCAPEPAVVVENHKRVKETRKELYDDVEEVAFQYHALWNGLGAASKGTIGIAAYNDENYLHQLINAGGVKFKYNWMHYDFTQHLGSVERAVEQVMKRLDRVQASTYSWHMRSLKKDLVGNVSASRLILVADRSGGCGRPNWPFAHNKGSSAFLNKTLHNLRVDEDKIAIININGDDGGDRFLGDAQVFSNKIIAMGNAADATLKTMCINNDAKIPHPQFARRFLFHGEQYDRKIRDTFAAIGVTPYLPVR